MTAKTAMGRLKMSQNGYIPHTPRLRAEGDSREFFVGVRGRSRAARLPVEPNMVTLRFGVVRRPRKRAKMAMVQRLQKCTIFHFLNVPNSLSQLAAKPYRRPGRAVYGSSSFSGAFVAPENGPKRMGPRRIQWIAKAPFINMNFRRRRNLGRKTRPSRTGPLKPHCPDERGQRSNQGPPMHSGPCTAGTQPGLQP